MVARDFNGDGKLDLIISDGTTADIVVFLGNGDGTFQNPGPPISGFNDVLFTVSDVNGNGKPDLVVGTTFVAVFLGNGNGTFTLKDSYLASALGGPIFVADFNGDGKPDVEVGGTLLLGSGDGSFQGNPAVSPNKTGFGPPMVTGDFNGDGNTDIALLSSNLYILLGDGTGKLSVAHTYTLPLPGSAIATADLNGDGKLDLLIVTIDPITQAGSLVVMLGNGDGSFGSPASFAVGTTLGAPIPIRIANFNGDGKSDVVVLNINSSNLSVFLGKGDGTFTSPVTYFPGSGASSLATADFNSDGIIDIASAGSAGLGILLGKGDGTFQPATFPLSGINAIFAAADLNGDGKADLVGSGEWGRLSSAFRCR